MKTETQVKLCILILTVGVGIGILIGWRIPQKPTLVSDRLNECIAKGGEYHFYKAWNDVKDDYYDYCTVLKNEIELTK